MTDHCKNCGLQFNSQHNYCEVCGAKVIRNRLTLKNIWDDVAENVLNFDHSLWRTIIDLTIKPEAVVLSYIDGVRKRYMNPIAYFGIALTISGLLLIFMRKFFIGKISFDMPGVGQTDPEVLNKILQVTLDFNTFVFILYIPVLALSGWLVLNRKGFLLTEYLVAGIYILAHFTIVTTPISIILLLISPENYLNYSLFTILIMAAYALFVTNRMDKASFWRSILFLMLYVVGYFGMGILLNIIMILTGVIELSDLVPKPPPPA